MGDQGGRSGADHRAFLEPWGSSLFLGLKFRLEGLDFQTDVGGVKHARKARDIETREPSTPARRGANRPSTRQRRCRRLSVLDAAPCNALQTPPVCGPATVPGYQPRAVAVISPPSFIP